MSKLAQLILGRSWRTSLWGYVGGVATIVIPTLQSGEMPSLNQWIVAFVLAGALRVAKDSGVSGEKK